MTFSSKDQALEAVIGGLSRVARAVVAIPVEGGAGRRRLFQLGEGGGKRRGPHHLHPRDRS
jgi:hypothetical protein